MIPLLVFAIVLFGAVLLSEYASRSILSVSVLFVVAGFLAGDGVIGLLQIDAGNAVFKHLAELALFSVLFTDGMHVGIRDLRQTWRLPGRALLLGMPLTLLSTAILANVLTGLEWPSALLLGAALSPTDPVFASALVGREEVPQRLQRLLNVESGLNDGLALPIVLVLLAVVGAQDVSLLQLLRDIALGVGAGIAIPWLAIHLRRREVLAAVQVYEPLFAFSVGLMIYAIATATHANEFLAAFAAGVTVASMSTEVREEFRRFGEIIVELLKLATLLLFGALISPSFFMNMTAGDYVFIAIVLFVTRPAAIGIAFLRGELNTREWIAAAWFGPKGFASVVYAILILESGAEQDYHLFLLASLVIVLSIILHSSTDILVVRWFEDEDETVQEPGAPRAEGEKR